MESVLSYFRSYFDPGERAPFENHSAGQIARHLFETLKRQGPVRYFGNKERPAGLRADLVLVVGNSYTFETFPPRWRHKIRLLNYAVDHSIFQRDLGVERRKEFCY